MAGLATAGTGGLLCGGAWIAATLIGEVLCPQPWCTKDPSPVYRWNTQNPPDSDDDSGDGSDADPEPTPDPNDPDGDYDGDGTTSREELKKADQKLWDEEITDEEHMRIWRKYACDQGDTSWCGK